MRTQRRISAKAYLTLVPSILQFPDVPQDSSDQRELPLENLQRQHRVSWLREKRLSRLLSTHQSSLQLSLDRQLSEQMQRTVQIERRISDQAGSLKDAMYKLEIALAYGDDSEIAWRLVQSAHRDLRRK